MINNTDSVSQDAITSDGGLRTTLTSPAGTFAFVTHRGLRRPANNDWGAVRVGLRHTTLAVADGVGLAEEAGEAAVVAAEIAAATGAHAGSAFLACQVARSAVTGHFSDVPTYVQRAGTTTLVVATVAHTPAGRGGRWVHIAWLGDSSAWQLNATGRFCRLTEPHNPPGHPNVVERHVTRGQPDQILQPNRNPIRRLLLCSDGLDGQVGHEVIRTIISDTERAEDARDLLLSAALNTGAKDNVTIVVGDLTT